MTVLKIVKMPIISRQNALFGGCVPSFIFFMRFFFLCRPIFYDNDWKKMEIIVKEQGDIHLALFSQYVVIYVTHTYHIFSQVVPNLFTPPSNAIYNLINLSPLFYTWLNLLSTKPTTKTTIKLPNVPHFMPTNETQTIIAGTIITNSINKKIASTTADNISSNFSFYTEIQ